MLLATAVWLLAFVGLLLWMNWDSFPDPNDETPDYGGRPSRTKP
jgi:hypothetical protein